MAEEEGEREGDEREAKGKRKGLSREERAFGHEGAGHPAPVWELSLVWAWSVALVNARKRIIFPAVLWPTAPA